MEYQQKIKGFDKACASQWGSWKCFRHGTYVDGAESSRVFLGGGTGWGDPFIRLVSDPCSAQECWFSWPFTA